nr:hypothetical protein [Novosphingobium jiangmenense]
MFRVAGLRARFVSRRAERATLALKMALESGTELSCFAGLESVHAACGKSCPPGMFGSRIRLEVEALGNRDTDGVCHVSCANAGQCLRTVQFDRARADRQPLGDVIRAHAPDDRAQNFGLAAGKATEAAPRPRIQSWRIIMIQSDFHGDHPSRSRGFEVMRNSFANDLLQRLAPRSEPLPTASFRTRKS